jgi:hypothetical protein
MKFYFSLPLLTTHHLTSHSSAPPPFLFAPRVLFFEASTSSNIFLYSIHFLIRHIYAFCSNALALYLWDINSLTSSLPSILIMVHLCYNWVSWSVFRVSLRGYIKSYHSPPYTHITSPSELTSNLTNPLLASYCRVSSTSIPPSAAFFVAIVVLSTCNVPNFPNDKT